MTWYTAGLCSSNCIVPLAPGHAPAAYVVEFALLKGDELPAASAAVLVVLEPVELQVEVVTAGSYGSSVLKLAYHRLA